MDEPDGNAGADGPAPLPGPSPATPAPPNIPAPQAEAPPGLARGLFGRPVKRRKRVRPHPYADEVSPAAELALNPRRVTGAWALLALVLIGSGYLLASRFSPYVPGAADPQPDWDLFLDVPLFLGIGLLGFGFGRTAWARRTTMAGWLVGAFFLGLWAQDLFYAEAQDYVNYAFAILFGLMFVYLAYQEWLGLVRRVDNAAVRFLSVSFFVGAGFYFLIDKIQSVRLWLINAVSGQTKWMLDLFGQGDKAGLVFILDASDPKSPTTFFYPSQMCEAPAYAYSGAIGDPVEQYCNAHGMHRVVHMAPDPHTWLQHILQFAPDGDHRILPVSIILACTALQSIMVFVGLFAGTTASLRRKVWASVIVAGVVYVLNLVRNTGIIWFYGQGHASFWVMHDAIGKGGSLVAMILIAFGVFRWFPEFLTALFGVLDLIERDGPVERALHLGRRRPTTPPTPAA